MYHGLHLFSQSINSKSRIFNQTVSLTNSTSDLQIESLACPQYLAITLMKQLGKPSTNQSVPPIAFSMAVCFVCGLTVCHTKHLILQQEFNILLLSTTGTSAPMLHSLYTHVYIKGTHAMIVIYEFCRLRTNMIIGSNNC